MFLLFSQLLGQQLLVGQLRLVLLALLLFLLVLLLFLLPVPELLDLLLGELPRYDFPTGDLHVLKKHLMRKHPSVALVDLSPSCWKRIYPQDLTEDGDVRSWVLQVFHEHLRTFGKLHLESVHKLDFKEIRI